MESAKIAFVVVSYRNSTSNHNRVPNHLYLQELYLIEILHQTTTRKTDRTIPLRCILSKFYIKPQRTTIRNRTTIRCILSKFYIKPQLYKNYYANKQVVSYRNSTSNHNHKGLQRETVYVVSYRNSTSNHNCVPRQDRNGQLYLIEILHQTTTGATYTSQCGVLYLIEILHQTTTSSEAITHLPGCILSKFYIKPQLGPPCLCSSCVVSYRNSTSNHNHAADHRYDFRVVSYRNSTSNHNAASRYIDRKRVVSYRNSTSNHNVITVFTSSSSLYLIEILHQTTTIDFRPSFSPSCILSKFYIKPQLVMIYKFYKASCILSKFYIKPQQCLTFVFHCHRCILSKFYIKPQPSTSGRKLRQSCILSKFYIKPQLCGYRPCRGHQLYLIEILHQTTTRRNSPNIGRRLYLIEILHQTTTPANVRRRPASCILSKFYIKPQLAVHPNLQQRSCILSKFYIKPQREARLRQQNEVVSYRNSTSNHNVGPHID